jgi:uncharacterized membrane protein
MHSHEDNVNDTTKRLGFGWGALVGWPLLGMVLSLICLGVGIHFAGGGHAWMVPVLAATTTLLTSPVTGAAWALRRTKAAWWIAVCLVIFGLLVDVWFLVGVLDDSRSWLRRAWEAAPLRVIVWAILFFGQQIVAWVIVLLHEIFRRERSA